MAESRNLDERADDATRIRDRRTAHSAVSQAEDRSHRPDLACQTKEHEGQESLRTRENGQRLCFGLQAFRYLRPIQCEMHVILG